MTATCQMSRFARRQSGARSFFASDQHNEMFLQRWTEELCRMDSDGDGKSNGEELGDPDCKWSKESLQPPEITLLNSLSHPGKEQQMKLMFLACTHISTYVGVWPLCRIKTKQSVISMEKKPEGMLRKRRILSVQWNHIDRFGFSLQEFVIRLMTPSARARFQRESANKKTSSSATSMLRGRMMVTHFSHILIQRCACMGPWLLHPTIVCPPVRNLPTSGFRGAKGPGRPENFVTKSCGLQAILRPHAHWTQRVTQRAKMEPGPILLLVACSVNSPVATIGFSPPNLLRFSRRVWCAWGLREKTLFWAHFWLRTLLRSNLCCPRPKSWIRHCHQHMVVSCWKKIVVLLRPFQLLFDVCLTKSLDPSSVPHIFWRASYKPLVPELGGVQGKRVLLNNS